MGLVTDELIALIAKQVQDHGIVVWYDPEKVYGDVADQLSLPDTTVLRCTQGFFELRHRIDPLLEFVADDGSTVQEAEVPPRLVVYVPIDRSASRHALAEVEAAGVVMEPAASHWQRNTRLKVIAERVFKQIVPDRALEIVRKVDEGSLSLAELDWLSDQTGDLGAVKLVFGTTAARDVAMLFACSEDRDVTLQKKRALGELADLFRADLGVEIDRQGTAADARRALCRGLLLAELAGAARRREVTLSNWQPLPFQDPRAMARRSWSFAIHGEIAPICRGVYPGCRRRGGGGWRGRFQVDAGQPCRCGDLPIG